MRREGTARRLPDPWYVAAASGRVGSGSASGGHLPIRPSAVTCRGRPSGRRRIASGPAVGTRRRNPLETSVIPRKNLSDYHP